MNLNRNGKEIEAIKSYYTTEGLLKDFLLSFVFFVYISTFYTRYKTVKDRKLRCHQV